MRDACACGECRHAGSGQRLRSVLAPAADTSGFAVAVDVDGDLDVDTFAPDGLVGRFSMAWLFAASVRTLRVRGGPMSDHEIPTFEALPHSEAAVTLRRFDELAKNADIDAPSMSTRCALIRWVLLAA